MAPINSFAGVAGERVLLLQSYHPRFPTADMIVEGAVSVFEPRKVVLDVEFMDTKRHPYEEMNQRLTETIAYKLANRPPYSAILTADDNALRFALEHSETLFRGLPIVFCGVNNIPLALEQNSNSRVTGVVEATSMLQTIELARQLQPELSRIIAVVDGTPSGQADLKSFEALKKNVSTIEMDTLDLRALSWGELAAKVNALQSDTALLLLSAYFDRRGERRSFEDGLKALKGNRDIAIYHLWYHGLGEGLLGGVVISHYEQARQAALRVLDILSGADPANIPVLPESPNTPVFDYTVAKRLGIDLDALPDNALVINKPEEMSGEQKRMVFAVVGLCASLVLIVVLLSLYLWIKRKAHRERRLLLLELENRNNALQDARDYLQELMDSMPSALFATDSDGYLIDFNQTAQDWNEGRDDLRRGASIFKLYPDLPISPVQLDRIIASKQTARYDRIALRAGENGAESIHVDIVVYPLGSAEGERAVFRLENVSHRVRLEEGMIHYEKMLSIGALASGMAHEINSPLGAIVQNVQNIQRRTGTSLALNKEVAAEIGIAMEDIARYLDRRGVFAMLDGMREAGEKIASLVDGLIIFTNRGGSARQLLNPKEMMERVVRIAASDYNLGKGYDFRDVSVSINAKGTLPDLYCVPGELEQAMLDVLLFGAQLPSGTFSKPDEKRIEISLEPMGDGVTVVLESNGRSLSEAEMRHLFDPFETQGQTVDGKGLGLSVAYFVFTVRHGGEMSVTPGQSGNGTRFIINLPASSPPIA